MFTALFGLEELHLELVVDVTLVHNVGGQQIDDVPLVGAILIRLNF